MDNIFVRVILSLILALLLGLCALFVSGVGLCIIFIATGHEQVALDTLVSIAAVFAFLYTIAMFFIIFQSFDKPRHSKHQYRIRCRATPDDSE